MRNRNEAPATILANTEVFDYLKEKVGERKTRTEAYRFRPCIRVALAPRHRPLVSGHARSIRAVGTYPAGEKRHHYHAPANRYA